MSEEAHAPTPQGADAVADHRWARVREIAADIARFEVADRANGLDEDQRTVLARLRISADRASARAMLADDLADNIASAERSKRV